MKTNKSLFIKKLCIEKIVCAVLVGLTLTGCNNDDGKGDEGKKEAGTCSFPSTGISRTESYGAFFNDDFDYDNCNNFDGTVSRWDGMTEPVALMAAPSSYYNSGVSCNQCLRLEGSDGTRIGRVVAECPLCQDNVMQIDGDSFQALTGAANDVGTYDVKVTPIPCPTSTNPKITMNVGTTGRIFNMNVANHTNPIKKVEADLGTGFVELARLGDSADFQKNFGFDTPNPVFVKLTDIFDQSITGIVNISVNQKTTLDTQFGECR